MRVTKKKQDLRDKSSRSWNTSEIDSLRGFSFCGSKNSRNAVFGELTRWTSMSSLVLSSAMLHVAEWPEWRRVLVRSITVMSARQTTSVQPDRRIRTNQFSVSRVKVETTLLNISRFNCDATGLLEIPLTSCPGNLALHYLWLNWENFLE